MSLAVDQHELLVWTLDRLEHETAARTPLPGLAADAFRAAGFASGLTALIAVLAERDGVELPDDWAGYLDEQRGEVAARTRRFAEVLPRVLTALHDAGVAALPVKGAVVAPGWPDPLARPMADLDLLVTPADRDRARDALVATGLPLQHRAPWEDVFLAWGDGSVGRLDGESAAHNGKIELHPGWVERLHHYLVDDGGALWRESSDGVVAGVACRTLPGWAVAAHVLGHLAAAVIRAEVRPMHVVDAVVVLVGLDEAEREALRRFQRGLDPRLVAPALWLVGAYRPDVVHDAEVAVACARLPVAAAARLAAVGPAAVLRDPATRTIVRWRMAFTRSPVERAHVARQALAPPAIERTAAQSADRRATVARQAARMRRAAARRTRS